MLGTKQPSPFSNEVQSYFTDDKIYCLHIAPSTDLTAEYAVREGLPLDAVQ